VRKIPGVSASRGVSHWLLLLTLASSAHLAEAGHGTPPSLYYSVLSIDADRLKTLLDHGLRPVLVDVRSPEEYQKGHIPEARSLSLDEPPERFRELPQASPLIVLYCDCPVAKINAAYQFLRNQGYRQVLVLDGGFAAWTARGYPIKR
jgi:rhodanese-related sulfurtransferase